MRKTKKVFKIIKTVVTRLIWLSVAGFFYLAGDQLDSPWLHWPLWVLAGLGAVGALLPTDGGEDDVMAARKGVKILKDFFGYKDDQTLKQFADEVKLLPDEDFYEIVGGIEDGSLTY